MPARALVPDDRGFDADTPADVQATRVAGFPVLLGNDGVGFEGTLPPGQLVINASTASPRWKLTVDGSADARQPAFGWATAFGSGRGGSASLTYEASSWYRLALAAQVGLWVVALVLVLRMRFGGEPSVPLARGWRSTPGPAPAPGGRVGPTGLAPVVAAVVGAGGPTPAVATAAGPASACVPATVSLRARARPRPAPIPGRPRRRPSRVRPAHARPAAARHRARAGARRRRPPGRLLGRGATSTRARTGRARRDDADLEPTGRADADAGLARRPGRVRPAARAGAGGRAAGWPAAAPNPRTVGREQARARARRAGRAAGRCGRGQRGPGRDADRGADGRRAAGRADAGGARRRRAGLHLVLRGRHRPEPAGRPHGRGDQPRRRGGHRHDLDLLGQGGAARARRPSTRPAGPRPRPRRRRAPPSRPHAEAPPTTSRMPRPPRRPPGDPAVADPWAGATAPRPAGEGPALRGRPARPLRPAPEVGGGGAPGGGPRRGDGPRGGRALDHRRHGPRHRPVLVVGVRGLVHGVGLDPPRRPRAAGAVQPVPQHGDGRHHASAPTTASGSRCATRACPSRRGRSSASTSATT